jgi:tol-pal system protein YbgF
MMMNKNIFFVALLTLLAGQSELQAGFTDSTPKRHGLAQRAERLRNEVHEGGASGQHGALKDNFGNSHDTAELSAEARLTQMMLRLNVMNNQMESMAHRIQGLEAHTAALAEDLAQERRSASEREQGQTKEPIVAEHKQVQQAPQKQKGVLGTLPAKQVTEITEEAKLDAKARYQKAYDLLMAGQYVKAEQVFRRFLAEHENHALAQNALYWLGETHYVRKDYSEAAATFLKGYQKYPKATKAPDNLLKLAYSLTELGEYEKGRTMLVRLMKEFPKARPEVQDAAGRQVARLESLIAKQQGATPSSFH